MKQHTPNGDYCRACAQRWPCEFSINLTPLPADQVALNAQIVADLRETILARQKRRE